MEGVSDHSGASYNRGMHAANGNTPMSDLAEKARQRAKQMGLPYDGALTPQEAHQMLRELPNAKLVDVRTRAELEWVGRIPGAVEVELLTYPGSRPNPEFVKQLEQKVEKDTPVLFICRSGGRSHNAAMRLFLHARKLRRGLR